MSAQDSPVCGLAAGRFSTFTARAGRAGTVPLSGLTPESGQTCGAAGVGEELTPEPPPELVPAGGLAAERAPRPPITAAAATPPAATSTITREVRTARPLLVGLIGRPFLRGRCSRVRRERLDGIGRRRAPQTPRRGD